MKEEIKTEAGRARILRGQSGEMAQMKPKTRELVSGIHPGPKNRGQKPNKINTVYIRSIIRLSLTAATDTLALILVTLCYSLLQCVTACYHLLPIRPLDLAAEALATWASILLDWQPDGGTGGGSTIEVVRSKPGHRPPPSSDLEAARAPTSIK